MRIFSALVVFGVLAVTAPAFADSIGCGDDTTVTTPTQDLAVPMDQARPRDLSSPSDLSKRGDARRERRARHRAAGAGLLLLCGLALSGIAVVRHRVRA